MRPAPSRLSFARPRKGAHLPRRDFARNGSATPGRPSGRGRGQHLALHSPPVGSGKRFSRASSAAIRSFASRSDAASSRAGTRLCVEECCSPRCGSFTWVGGLRKIAISEITSGENVSHPSKSAPAPAVPQWKFIHVLSAKNDSSVSSLSDDGAARETLHRRSIAAETDQNRGVQLRRCCVASSVRAAPSCSAAVSLSFASAVIRTSRRAVGEVRNPHRARSHGTWIESLRQRCGRVAARNKEGCRQGPLRCRAPRNLRAISSASHLFSGASCITRITRVRHEEPGA